MKLMAKKDNHDSLKKLNRSLIVSWVLLILGTAFYKAATVWHFIFLGALVSTLILAILLILRSNDLRKTGIGEISAMGIASLVFLFICFVFWAAYNGSGGIH